MTFPYKGEWHPLSVDHDNDVTVKHLPTCPKMGTPQDMHMWDEAEALRHDPNAPACSLAREQRISGHIYFEWPDGENLGPVTVPAQGEYRARYVREANQAGDLEIYIEVERV